MENDLFYAMVWKTYHFNPGMENAIMENDVMESVVMENDVVPTLSLSLEGKWHFRGLIFRQIWTGVCYEVTVTLQLTSNQTPSKL